MTALLASLFALLLPLLASAAANDVLYLYNRHNDIAEETIRRFEVSCHCQLKQDFYSDNEEMLAKLKDGAVGYDLIVATGNAVESLIDQKALSKLDKTRLPHLKNLNSAFLNTWFDPGNQYSVPYAYKVTLIGYNIEKLRELNLPTDTWALLFEPKYLAQIKGRVSVLNSASELMAAAMLYLGYSVHDLDPAKWTAAKDLILRARPYWATLAKDTDDKALVLGNIWLAQGYSSDMYRARADARAAGRPFEIGFTIPREGAVLALDSFVIQRSAPHPKLAHDFINFMLDGGNAADASNLIGAGNPNAAALPLINRDVTENPALFPGMQEIKRLQMLREFDLRSRRLMSRLWIEIKVH